MIVFGLDLLSGLGWLIAGKLGNNDIIGILIWQLEENARPDGDMPMFPKFANIAVAKVDGKVLTCYPLAAPNGRFQYR